MNMTNEALADIIDISNHSAQNNRLENARRDFNGNSNALDQELINTVFKGLDDMFLRFFCMGTDKSEIERFKQKGISSIMEIRKTLDSLGLKFKDDL